MLFPEHGVVFVHPPKTGGCSVEEALAPFGDRSPDDLQAKTHKGMTFALNYQHAYPRELKHEFRVFGFCRNPWDRMVSYWCHLQRHELLLEPLSFRSLLLYWDQDPDALPIREDEHRPTLFMAPCYEWLFEADYIGYFENLRDDFTAICSWTGFPPVSLPHVNATKHLHYSQYYDDYLIDLVREHYRIDIESFGYSFRKG